MSRPILRSLPLVAASLVPLTPLTFAAPQDAAAATEETVDGALAQIDAFIADAKIDRGAADWKTKLPAPPKLAFTPDLQYLWKLETSEGPITVRLLNELAPMHASTTIYLARVGFYDGLSFHRVINGFMAQGGDPLGTGTGGPGFQIDGEVTAEARHDRVGVLSAANRGRGTKEGSQFFLTFGPTPHLDGVHTVYGYVIDGLETLRALDAQGTRGGTPKKPLSIVRTSIEVRENPLASMADDHDSDDAAIAGLRTFITEQEAEKAIDRSAPAWKTRLPKPPQQTFTAGKTYRWNLMTNKGPISIDLLTDVAPMHASSTIYLTMAGFYDGLAFHRVIPGFMAQGGCPVGNGTGFPGFKMNRELSADVKHSKRGILSAANLGRNGTDGSQFFLTFGPTPHLDGGYTVYGVVSSGIDVLDDLEKAGSRSGRTSSPLEILKATITIE